MGALGIFIWFAITIVISYFNSAVRGRWKDEAKQAGGSVLWIYRAGAIMAVCGWFMVFAVAIGYAMEFTGAMDALIVFVGSYAGFDPQPGMGQAALEAYWDIAYLLVVFPILGAGFPIWLNSIAMAAKRKDLPSIGVAGWNTYAMVRNTASAIKYVPKSTKNASKNIKKLIEAAGTGAVLLVFILPLILALGLAIWVDSAIANAADEQYKLSPEYSY